MTNTNIIKYTSLEQPTMAATNNNSVDSNK